VRVLSTGSLPPESPTPESSTLVLLSYDYIHRMINPHVTMTRGRGAALGVVLAAERGGQLDLQAALTGLGVAETRCIFGS